MGLDDILLHASNCYKVLGLEDDASEADVERRFREISKENHPDKPSGNATKFHEALEAKDALTKINRELITAAKNAYAMNNKKRRIVDVSFDMVIDGGTIGDVKLPIGTRNGDCIETEDEIVFVRINKDTVWTRTGANDIECCMVITGAQSMVGPIKIDHPTRGTLNMIPKKAGAILKTSTIYVPGYGITGGNMIIRLTVKDMVSEDAIEIKNTVWSETGVEFYIMD
jgi:DnaJ-class molecular chaperone